MKVCLDAGHGGPDPGAVGGGLKEEDLTLSIVQRMVPLFEAAGHEVVLTRDSDKKVTNQQRVKICNKAKADAYVAVHVNAAATSRAHGHEVIYCPGSKEGRALAQAIHDSVLEELDIKDRGIKTDTATGRGPFTVLRKTKPPAVIVEVAFITNEEDRAVMDEDTEHDGIAVAIVGGILAWAGEEVTAEPKPPGEPVVEMPASKEEAEQNLLNGWEQFVAIFKDGKLDPAEVPLLLTATSELLGLVAALLLVLRVDPNITGLLSTVISVLNRLADGVEEKRGELEAAWKVIVSAFSDGRVELREIVPLLEAIVDLLAITWNILLPFVHMDEATGPLILKLKKVLEWLTFLAALARPPRSGPTIPIT